MTTSTSRLSFTDCFDAFEQALADTKGIRIRCVSRDAATHLRMRMHTARTIDRRDNKEVYAETPDHPLYGRSVYDDLVIRLRPDDAGCWLYVQKIALRGEVQALSELPEADWEPVPMLPQPAPQVLVLERRAASLMIEHVKRRV